MQSTPSDSEDLLDNVSLRKSKRQKSLKYLRGSEIDRALSESESDLESLFGEDTFCDRDFFEICQVKKCKNQGFKPCECSMLVCKEHYKPKQCEHKDHFFDSDEEEFKKTIVKKKGKEKDKKPTKQCIKKPGSTEKDKNETT